MLKLHAETHTDHVPAQMIDYVLDRFKDRTAFFTETFELPAHLPTLDCGLNGPAVGDGPIIEDAVTYKSRGDRKYQSRMIGTPARPTRTCTVIAGPYKGEPCVLYTVFGGPLAPPEPGNFPAEMDNEARQRAVTFWAQHALSE
jgi:hypothetical protein